MFDIDTHLKEYCSKRQCIRHSSMYAAPEVFGGAMRYKSDVWSLGISIIEMARIGNPYAGRSEEEVKKAVLDGDPPSLFTIWSHDLIDFVNRCLVKDVEKRASVAELLEVSVSL